MSRAIDGRIIDEVGCILLGLEEGMVVLANHDPQWVLAYHEEAVRIRAALGGRALDVQHCGSTAIPGIKAKPILDIVVGIADLSTGRLFIRPLGEIGYEYRGDRIVAGEHFFVKGVPRTHHLHLAVWRGTVWNEKMMFRDRLLADRTLAQTYEAIKVALAACFPRDRASYTWAKAAFIRPVVDGMVDQRRRDS